MREVLVEEETGAFAREVGAALLRELAAEGWVVEDLAEGSVIVLGAGARETCGSCIRCGFGLHGGGDALEASLLGTEALWTCPALSSQTFEHSGQDEVLTAFGVEGDCLSRSNSADIRRLPNSVGSLRCPQVELSKVRIFTNCGL